MIKYTKDNPLRCFFAFEGYNAQGLSLNRLKEKYPDFDWVCVGRSEIDPYAIKAANAIFPESKDKNYGDISLIDWSQVPDFDLFTMSSPCFVAGTLVLTDSGYKPIEDITNNDKVLTHTNTFQKVVTPMQRTYRGDIYEINAMAFNRLFCTPEHPFFVRKRYRYGHKQIRAFHSPEWVKAKDLTKDFYLGYAINTESKLPIWRGVVNNMWGRHRISNKLSPLFTNRVFWYIMGRYVGDGWKSTSKTQKGNGIVICCSDRNENSLNQALKNIGFHFRIAKGRTVTKYHIHSNELHEFVSRYGYYSYGKHIDIETLNLPKELLEGFMQGALDSDGCFTNNRFKISCVSRELIYGLGQCVAKVYSSPFSIYYTKRKKQTIIENRLVNQRDSWTIVWKTEKKKQDHAFFEDGYIWFPINSIDCAYGENIVYNMEVENDNSYTANGAIVHNCTDFSSAGLQRGGQEGSGTRSSLLWQCRKAIIAKRPKYILFENVKALTQSKFIRLFNKWQSELESYGYTNFTKVLNSADYGVPQHRERVFMVSILDCDQRFEFPNPFPLEKRLKDVLEEEVDESYYLNQEKVDEYCNKLLNEKSNGDAIEEDFNIGLFSKQ